MKLEFAVFPLAVDCNAASVLHLTTLPVFLL